MAAGSPSRRRARRPRARADIQAATAIAPGLPAEAKRYGLAAEAAPGKS